MTKQIMKLDIPYNGTWKVIHDDNRKCNQFSVYYIRDGHRRLIERYGDLTSCLHCVTQQLTGHEWRMTDRKVERLI